MEFDLKIPVGVSNRHIHLSQADLETLFGPGYQLTKYKDLSQPGQFAAQETVAVRGPKGSYEKVRILGPVRAKSQVEISLTDAYFLGVKAPIKESGQHHRTPGLEINGPHGHISLDSGTIVALRHIHMTPPDAERMGVHDKDLVEVETLGERRAILGNVLVRVAPEFALELHVDIDEANACALENGDYVILKKSQE